MTKPQMQLYLEATARESGRAHRRAMFAARSAWLSREAFKAQIDALPE